MKKRCSLLVLPWLALVDPGAAQEKPRVYLVDRDDWKLSGGFAATQTSATGSIHAGVRPVNICSVGLELQLLPRFSLIIRIG